MCVFFSVQQCQDEADDERSIRAAMMVAQELADEDQRKRHEAALKVRLCLVITSVVVKSTHSESKTESKTKTGSSGFSQFDFSSSKILL